MNKNEQTLHLYHSDPVVERATAIIEGLALTDPTAARRAVADLNSGKLLPQELVTTDIKKILETADNK